MPGDPRIPFVFVPEGTSAPDAVREPEWVRIPATFVPRGGGRVTAASQNWPKDRFGRRPICPLTELPPGGPVPGEGAPEGNDPVAAFIATQAVFHDPAGAAGLAQLTAAGGRGSGGTAPAGPAAPTVPDTDKQWRQTQPGRPPVYDIYVGGLGDQSSGHAVLNYAQRQGMRGERNVVYFPYDANASADAAGPALARYIDTPPADAKVNLIGHSYGGDTTAKAAALTTHSINLSITIDPVSSSRPDMAAVRARVHHWIDVDAVTGGVPTVGNGLAFLGGA